MVHVIRGHVAVGRSSDLNVTLRIGSGHPYRSLGVTLQISDLSSFNLVGVEELPFGSCFEINSGSWGQQQCKGAKEATLHHYSKSFRGFSAMLTPEQAQRVAENDGVVSVFKSRTNKLHTTHTWDFLGIDSIQQYKDHLMDSSANVIVGVIDSGVWPESEENVKPEKSLHCLTAIGMLTFPMKIIGARYYFKGFEAEHGSLESQGGTFFRSARDSDGHGSHTTSTIAGSVVANVSLSGMARGNARGGAPSARLAIYKACRFNLCSDADTLLAMDDAISTASNVAHWILTVATISVDRIFNSNVYLGNSRVLKGFSLNPLEMDASYGLVDGSAAAAKGVTPNNASFCKNNTLDATLIKGKIVACTIEAVTDDRRKKSIFIRQGGGVGIILIDPLAKDFGFQFVLPGPGLYILAAWSPIAIVDTAERSVDYNIISGPLSCPHIFPHIGASPAQLKNLTGQLTYYQKPLVPSYDLNYPSIGVSNMNGSLSVHRTVTYYGNDATVYYAYIDHPVGVKVRVTPSKLCFTKTGEKMSFRVDFMPYEKSNGSFVFGALTWSNGIHKVRSPIGLGVLYYSDLKFIMSTR
ncbi:pentatricopeptide repeat-containing protein [Hibiscus syriacus]|uniref:Pentatricopeptide repeat-containing protein n=1 Tax=Hibiscus syriacus TaxID=106335 RepID=A0A6A3ARH4_HIBSY|nr:pentatricopeptide repeat-containing protein [Hibiscus syriacus]